jgi:hypothetical protein
MHFNPYGRFAFSASSTRRWSRSGATLFEALISFQRHAGPEPIVLAAERVEVGTSYYLSGGTILLGHDPQQSPPKTGIRFRITHFR